MSHASFNAWLLPSLRSRPLFCGARSSETLKHSLAVHAALCARHCVQQRSTRQCTGLRNRGMSQFPARSFISSTRCRQTLNIFTIVWCALCRPLLHNALVMQAGQLGLHSLCRRQDLYRNPSLCHCRRRVCPEDKLLAYAYDALWFALLFRRSQRAASSRLRHRPPAVRRKCGCAEATDGPRQASGRLRERRPHRYAPVAWRLGGRCLSPHVVAFHTFC